MDLASSTPPPAAAGVPGAPSRRMLGEAGIDSTRRRVHDCERPIRLRGSTRLVNPSTGEIRTLYASAQELDGTTWIPCGNRRAAACEPCSRRYQGDAWQLVTTGLAGEGFDRQGTDHRARFGQNQASLQPDPDRPFDPN